MASRSVAVPPAAPKPKTRRARAKPDDPQKQNGRSTTRQPSPAKSENGSSNGHGDQAALEEILEALIAARDGDFAHRLSRRRRGILGEIASAYNEFVGMNARMDKEFGRIRRVIGREGRMDQRASLGPAGGSWESTVESINDLVDDLVRPTTEVARVIDAVADG